MTKDIQAWLCGMTMLFVVPAALARDDIAEKGPYHQRRFARVLGQPYSAPPAEASQSLPAPLMVDPKGSGETNELIVLLNYDKASKLPGFAKLARQGSSPAAIERAVVDAVVKHLPEASQVFAGATHARSLISTGRLSDDERVRGAAAGSARERLERYLVLSYPSVAQAQAAKRHLEKTAAFLSVSHNWVATTSFWFPNDPYFGADFVVGPSEYPKGYSQWGLYAMRFLQAWGTTRGHAQIGLLEPGFPGTFPNGVFKVHPELERNFRQHFISCAPVDNTSTGDVQQREYNMHAVHVAGIISAQLDNGVGTTGACPDCSLTLFAARSDCATPSTGYDAVGVANALRMAVDVGMQVVNWSGSGRPGDTCESSTALKMICDTLEYAAERDVLLVEAVGNRPQEQLSFPLNQAHRYAILKVGGTSITDPAPGVPGALWTEDAQNGSWKAGTDGVIGPAKSIVSTMNAGQSYRTVPVNYRCGDTAGVDESGTRYSTGNGDGVGSCTGTSMAAPHVTALAGLVRSINPRLTALQLRQLIQQSGNLASNVTLELGSGLPSAALAVEAALATNPSRLTPLFSFYSTERSDSFYTTLPQMANAALDGALMPRQRLGVTATNASHGTYESAYGRAITGYPSFPRSPFVVGPSGNITPLAQVLVFTTPANPTDSAVPLAPLYRMSWKCGDPTTYPPQICQTNPKHIDSILVNEEEIGYVKSVGYRVDGIEGYVYPKTAPQPPGTVRLMRKYHPGRDDHAAFPETELASMQGLGYSQNSNNTDWLGYVLPNTPSQPPGGADAGVDGGTGSDAGADGGMTDAGVDAGTETDAGNTAGDPDGGTPTPGGEPPRQGCSADGGSLAPLGLMFVVAALGSRVERRRRRST